MPIGFRLTSPPLRVGGCFLATMLLGGCGQNTSSGVRQAPLDSKSIPQTNVSDRSSGSARRFVLKGVVRAIDRETGLVAIRHEEIPDFMPAMTMSFPLKSQGVFDELQVGDHVEGELRVDATESVLSDVVITEMADPAAALAAERQQALLLPGQVVPDFEFTNQDGQASSLFMLRGSPVVLTFVYTRCPLPDFCPAQDRKFAELARRVRALGNQGDAVRLLSISFDPEHDTPNVLEQHARAVGARPPIWTFAVATHEQLAKVSRQLGLTYGPGEKEISHTLSTALIAPDGRLARLELGKSWPVDDFFSALRTFLPRAAPEAEPSPKTLHEHKDPNDPRNDSRKGRNEYP